MNIETHFKAIGDLRARQETALNYALVANLGTCGMVALQSALSTSSPLLSVGISLGLAALVDAQMDRSKIRKQTIQSQTEFVKEYGTTHEAAWADELSNQERAAVQKYCVVTAGVVGAAIGGFVVALPFAQHFNGVLMTAALVLSFIAHKKASKHSESQMDEAKRNRTTLVEEIYQRRTILAEPPSNTLISAPKI